MMLVYDPAGRISAKQACNHPYFENLETVPNNNPRPQYHGSGYH